MQGEDLGTVVLEPFLMAKKKPDEKPRPKQETLLVYKADPQMAPPFKEWLEGLAEHVGAPVTITLDMALKAFAEKNKYRPMPKRLAR